MSRALAVRAVAALVVGFLPLVVATTLVPGANTTVVALACLCGLQTTVTAGSWRVGAVLTGWMAVSVLGATLCAGTPALAALWMAVVAAGAGVAARRGLLSAYAVVGIVNGFVVVAPEPVPSALKIVATPAAAAGLDVAAKNLLAAALAGAWAVAAAAWLAPLGRRARRCLSARAATLVALALALATGVSALVVLAWYPVPLAAWLFLTLYVLAAPAAMEAGHRVVRRKSAQRLLGTLGGVFAAVLLARAIHSTAVLHALGVACLLASAALSLLDRDPRRYWRSVLFLTPAMVFIDSDAGTAVRAGELRLAFTAAGALLAAALATAAALVAQRVLERPDAAA